MLELILGMAHAALFGAFVKSALDKSVKNERRFLILYAIFSFLMAVYLAAEVAGKIT